MQGAVAEADMVFVCAGMGGGTGTGVAPVVAQVAKEGKSIVIGVVTMPFSIEKARIDKAEWGLKQLREVCNTVIVIDNNRLLFIDNDHWSKDGEIFFSNRLYEYDFLDFIKE